MNANGNERRAGGLESHDLSELLDRWGTDLAVWPDSSLADDARRLIDRDATARAHWTEARALDGLLDSVPSHSPTADLADRIVATATESSQPTNVISLAGAGRRRRIGWPSVALAASLVIGLLLGAGVSPDTVDGWLGGTTVYAADYLGVGPLEASE